MQHLPRAHYISPQLNTYISRGTRKECLPHASHAKPVPSFTAEAESATTDGEARIARELSDPASMLRLALSHVFDDDDAQQAAADMRHDAVLAEREEQRAAERGEHSSGGSPPHSLGKPHPSSDNRLRKKDERELAAQSAAEVRARWPARIAAFSMRVTRSARFEALIAAAIFGVAALEVDRDDVAHTDRSLNYWGVTVGVADRVALRR